MGESITNTLTLIYNVVIGEVGGDLSRLQRLNSSYNVVIGVNGLGSLYKLH